MYESAVKKVPILSNKHRVLHRIGEINIPVGTGFHDISKLPIPALSNCTFSGSPGHAVSKHHKSLQQTYENQKLNFLQGK
jgi:hypothetical protein